MMIKRYCLVPLYAAAMLLAAAPARAEVTDCDAGTLSNVEQGECLTRVLARDDAALNRAFQQALASIDRSTEVEPPQRAQWKDAMRRAQRAWVAFRDADCGELMGWEWYGGSGRGIAQVTCRIERTRARTEDLRTRSSAN